MRSKKVNNFDTPIALSYRETAVYKLTISLRNDKLNEGRAEGHNRVEYELFYSVPRDA